MTLSEFTSLSARIATTLKFRVVAISLLVTVVATALTTIAVLNATERNMQRAILDSEADSIERLAQVFSAQIERHQTALALVAGGVSQDMLGSSEQMAARFRAVPTLANTFDSMGVTDLGGRALFVMRGKAVQADNLDMGDRPYFQRTLSEGAPQISDVLLSRLTGDPAVVFTMPVRNPDGDIIAVAWGGVRLLTNSLLGSMSATTNIDHRKIVAFDGNGHILMHPDRTLIMKDITVLAGVGQVYTRWKENGAVADAGGTATLHDGQVVAMAGVPSANWLLAAVSPEDEAFAAVTDGEHAAWLMGTIAAIFASFITIGAMYWLTRPVEQLRKRAHQLLTDHDDIESNWPHVQGEIGELARVFLHILRERSAVEASTMQLLGRLQAVLDNASVGIAFTRDKRFELTSRTFCNMLGYEQYEMIGGPARMIYRDDDEYRDLGARVVAAFGTGESFSGESVLVRKDGAMFWGHLLGRPLEFGNPNAGTIWILEDVTEEREMREQLTWTATHDPLTGLVNRREFDTRMRELVKHAGDTSFCALFIDLDKFKAVNDTAGHAAGDRLLCDLAHIIDQAVRNSDTAARLGGDEFAVLLAGCSLQAARRIAEDIRAAIEQYRLAWEGTDYSVGASIGLVEVDGNFSNFEDVMQAADAACYAAKRRGRNRVCVHGERADEVLV